MSEAVQTLDGWYALHDYRTIDWASWNSIPEEDRQEALEELQVYIRKEPLRGNKKRKFQCLYYHWTQSRPDVYPFPSDCGRT